LCRLAEFLGPEQPLYGIEPPSDEAPLPTSIDEWIEFHRERFDRLPIDPPYFVAGFSFGGVVALEIARQLRAEGSTVGWLGLVDTVRPKLNPQGVRYLTYHFLELRQVPGSRRREYVRRLWKGGRHRKKVRVKLAIHRLLARLHLEEPRSTSFADVEGMKALRRSVVRSYLGYVAVPYDAPATLFVTQATIETAFGDPTLRWSRFITGGLDRREIEGGHNTLFAPDHLHSIGDAIRDSLERVRESARPVRTLAGSRDTHEPRPLRREGTSGR
jgi:aspartate racemase